MRIMTYNIRGGLGMEGKRSTLRCVDVIRGLLPDVVCLQEVHRRLPWSGGEDQPAIFRAETGQQFHFFQLFHYWFGHEGIAIGFRGTLSERIQHDLPSGRERRGVLEVRLRGVGGLRSLTVLCTHWGLSENERMEQSAACLEIIKNAPCPLILCGDFNETADSAALQNLIMSSGLTDAGAENDLPTFPADNPTKRIDLILYSPDLRLNRVETVDSLASDHLPFSADFEKV